MSLESNTKNFFGVKFQSSRWKRNFRIMSIALGCLTIQTMGMLDESGLEDLGFRKIEDVLRERAVNWCSQHRGAVLLAEDDQQELVGMLRGHWYTYPPARGGKFAEEEDRKAHGIWEKMRYHGPTLRPTLTVCIMGKDKGVDLILPEKRHERLFNKDGTTCVKFGSSGDSGEVKLKDLYVLIDGSGRCECIIWGTLERVTNQWYKDYNAYKKLHPALAELYRKLKGTNGVENGNRAKIGLQRPKRYCITEKREGIAMKLQSYEDGDNGHRPGRPAPVNNGVAQPSQVPSRFSQRKSRWSTVMRKQDRSRSTTSRNWRQQPNGPEE